MRTSHNHLLQRTRMHLFATVLFVFLMVMVFSNYSIAEEKFSKENWSPELLAMYQEGPKYLPADFDTGVTSPPLNQSIETRADINTLVFFKNDRNDSDTVSLIEQENGEFSSWDLFEETHYSKGSQFPKLGDLVSKLEPDLNYMILRDKMKFARVRPSSLASEINPIIENPRHPSYPSGHAAQSYFAAILMSNINPTLKKAYLDSAKNVAHRREIAGIHFPTDTAAGYTLAENVYTELMLIGEIEKLFLEAKQEFQQNKI